MNATYTKNCTIDDIAVYKVHTPESIQRNCTGFLGYGRSAGYVGEKADGTLTDIYEDAFQAARAARQ